MAETQSLTESNLEASYRQRARQKAIVNEQLARIVEVLLENMKRVRYVCFQSQAEPSRRAARMRCAGCVQAVRATVPAVGTLDAICDAGKKNPIKLENEVLNFKEKEADYILFENMCNREITRALAFETDGFIIYLFLTKSSITPNFVDVIAQARNILKNTGLSMIQLVEVPKRSAMPVADVSNPTTFNYRSSVLPYALRQTKRQNDQAIIFFAISPQRSKWEWRVQEIVMMQLKFPQAYFLTTVVDMKPEHYEKLCQTCYWLNKLNLVWFVNFQDPKIASLFSEDLFYYEVLRQDLTSESVGTDLDELYNVLLERYYPISEPNSTDADVILQLPTPDEIVYYGVKAVIQSRQKPPEVPEPPPPPQQRRSRTADLLGDPDAPVLDSDEEAGNNEDDDVENDAENLDDDAEKPPGEAELRQQYCNTKVVIFTTPRAKSFAETIQELGRIKRNFLNSDVFVCIQNLNRLNYAQFVAKLPELERDLGCIWDIDNLYFKIAGNLQCTVQVFDKQNKLLYDGNDCLKAIELIRKRETKKMKSQRLYLFGDLDEVKPKKKKSRQGSRSNLASPMREIYEADLEISGVNHSSNAQLEEKPAVNIEDIQHVSEAEIAISQDTQVEAPEAKSSAYNIISDTVQERQPAEEPRDIQSEEKTSKKRSRRCKQSGEEAGENAEQPPTGTEIRPELTETVIPEQKDVAAEEENKGDGEAPNNESPAAKSSKKRSRKHKSEEQEENKNEAQNDEAPKEEPAGQNAGPEPQMSAYEAIAEGSSPKQPKKKKKRSADMADASEAPIAEDAEPDDEAPAEV